MCHKYHQIKFHSFVLRKSFQIDNIFGVRILCNYNYYLNKSKNTKLQYTITILPAFIQPYARKSTETILNSSIDYINNDIIQQEAAFNLGYENISSFTRYFYRITDRIDCWILNITEKISEISSNNDFTPRPFNKKTIKEKWEDFLVLVNKYFKIIETHDTGILILDEHKVPCILAIFTSSIKGLGP